MLNCLLGKKAVAVSVIPSSHNPIVRSQDDDGLIWCEFASSAYTAPHISDSENPLWGLDAVVYILSSIAPLSSHDVAAIDSCISKGIPCVMALSKLDLLPEDERSDVIETVKNQLLSRYGSDELILLNAKDCFFGLGLSWRRTNLEDRSPVYSQYGYQSFS